MIAASNRHGYAHATVSTVIAGAGVSRPTFYEYFPDRSACFRAALADVQRRLLEEVGAAVAAAAPEHAAGAAIVALLEFVCAQPARARFAMHEAMAAGRHALDMRDAGVDAIAQLLERARARTPIAAAIPDLAPSILIGAICRLLAGRLRHGEPALAESHADLLTWLANYELPSSKQRWWALRPGPPPPRLSIPALEPLPAPSPMSGPGSRSGERAAERQRRRILIAAAELAQMHGCDAVAVSEIIRRAGVDGHCFYRSFVDKREAFMAIHEVGAQQLLSVTATAFFGTASWPERVWLAGRAFAQFLEDNPLVTHLGFVESHAIGPGAAQRVEHSQLSFTMFLQEGYQHGSTILAPSRVALEATIAAIAETVYRQARASREPQLSGLLPHMAFLCLAPSLGAAEANRFIKRKEATRTRRTPLASSARRKAQQRSEP